MASRTRRFLISRPGAESCSSTIRWRAAAKSESTAGCEIATARRTVWRRHNGRIAPRIGGKIRLFSRYAHRFVENRQRLSNSKLTKLRYSSIRRNNVKLSRRQKPGHLSECIIEGPLGAIASAKH